MRMGQGVRTGLGHGGHYLCLADTIFNLIIIIIFLFFFFWGGGGAGGAGV